MLQFFVFEFSMFLIPLLHQKGGRKNEVFVDVLERLTVLYTPNVSISCFVQ